MRILRGLVVLTLSATGLAIPFRGAAPVVITSRPVPLTSPAAYPASAKEHYLTTDQFGYVRPGFKLILNGITIGDDRKPVVDVSFTDDADQPLDRQGKVTPGALSISFVLSWWNPAMRDYTAYTTRTRTGDPAGPHPGETQIVAGADQNGTWSDVALGRAVYTFKTALPQGFDQTKTTTLGAYATRDLIKVDPNVFEKNYYANLEYDFRPDGQAVTDKWDMIDTAACNNCHDPISAHGGSRRDVKLCVLCHSPQSTDVNSGNTVNFKVMIHKIHMGANLPSVVAGTPYVIGFGERGSDFSTVVFPQDVRNCTKCHAATASQAPNYFTYPSRAACGSCHDDVNFATGENHPGGIQVDDSACASCHVPQGDKEFDASILGAHTIPEKSTQLKGLNAEIVSVTGTNPGQHPVVTFKLTNGDGSVVDPSTPASVNVLIGGPTVEYSLAPPFRESAKAASFDGTVGTYTMTNALPDTASGTWLASMEVRRNVTIDEGTNSDGSPKTEDIEEGALNPIFYFTVTDAQPVYRRTVVKKETCDVCHDKLEAHGSQRFIIRECVACHNPNATDVSRRPADAGAPEAISFGRMIHRIHRGENLTKDFTIYGFGGSKNTFNDVLYPGDLRNCAKCHVNDSQQLPLPSTNLPVQTPPPPQEWYTPMQTTAAACLGCHDTQEAAAHAFVNTAPFGEACAACHAPEDEFAVDKVHAR